MAPFLGLMAGAVLMVLLLRKIRAIGDFFGRCCVGCIIAVTTAFLVRQREGIAPGMLYYSASISFVVSGW